MLFLSWKRSRILQKSQVIFAEPLFKWISKSIESTSREPRHCNDCVAQELYYQPHIIAEYHRTEVCIAQPSLNPSLGVSHVYYFFSHSIIQNTVCSVFSKHSEYLTSARMFLTVVWFVLQQLYCYTRIVAVLNCVCCGPVVVSILYDLLRDIVRYCRALLSPACQQPRSSDE